MRPNGLRRGERAPGRFNSIQSSWFGHILAAIEAIGVEARGTHRRYGRYRVGGRSLRFLEQNQDGFMPAYRALARLFASHRTRRGAGSCSLACLLYTSDAADE